MWTCVHSGLKSPTSNWHQIYPWESSCACIDKQTCCGFIPTHLLGLCVCLCVSVYACMCMCFCVCTCLCVVCARVCTCVCICVHVFRCVCCHICVQGLVCVCMCACVCVCMCLNVLVCWILATFVTFFPLMFYHLVLESMRCCDLDS